MKVLKSTLLKKRRCEFGKFELVPSNGWKIDQSFIDFESGLLVVSESDENEDHWEDTGFGSRSIPNQQYIIDPKTGVILTAQEWSQYFSYETQTHFSEDGKYKLMTTRVHESERNSDGIKEELIDLKTRKTISKSDGIAFRKNKRVNLLDSMYARQKEAAAHQAKIDTLPTLVEHYNTELTKLTAGDIILDYHDEDYIYQLLYNGRSFELQRVAMKWSHNLNWSTINYTSYQNFENLEAFNATYLIHTSWYLNHHPFKKEDKRPNIVLKRFITEFCNELRKSQDFTSKEYYKIHAWENFYYQHDEVKPSAFKQYCAHCKATVRYNPRYPKHICRNCASKKITDENGIEVSFSNVGMSGGLKIHYQKNGTIFRTDDSQIEKRCFIEGKPYIATEARFGGIVIESE